MNPQPEVAEITPAQLAARIEAGEAVQLLDVRAPFRLAGGTVDIGPRELFFNIAGSQLMALPDARESGLDPALPVVTICGHGNSSWTVAAFLAQRGWNAASMSGGMAEWMHTLLPRQLDPPAGFTRLVQFDRVGKGSLGYLLVSDGEAIAIDVPRNTGPYELAAAESGARIVAVADTHAHADYISGGRELAARLCVPYYLHPADAVYPYDGTPGRIEFSPLSDGQELRIGAGSLTVVHTPGHTEGSKSFIAGGTEAGAAFTGDFIFIGSVGRPDLAGKTDEWSSQLFASLSRAKQQWPAGLYIHPAHYANAGERNANHSVGMRFDAVLSRNPQLAMEDEAQFRQWIVAHLSTPPDAYRRIKAVNLGLYAPPPSEADELECGRNECALK